MHHLKIAAFACFLFAGCTEGTDVTTGTTNSELGHHLTCPAAKVLICHMPPGNPTNVQEICVSPSAVNAHVTNHGDNVGGCYVTCEQGARCDRDADCCRGETCDTFNHECAAAPTPL